jgi:hypothetical protein
MRALLSLLGLASLAMPAMAVDLPLPIVLSTCTAAAPASGPAVLDNRGAVRLAGATTGTVRVNCPIDPGKVVGHNRHEIAVTYRDSTGLAAGAEVAASVIEVNTFTGQIRTVATFTSNDRASKSLTTGIKTFLYDFNYAFNFYYLEVSVSRGAAAQIAAAYLAGVK